MNTPRLSVVMPIHNGARWLGAALESLPSGEPGLQVIVRDLSPAKPCADIIARFADRLAIDYIWMPETPSWTRKTNLAVEAASCGLHFNSSPGRPLATGPVCCLR